MAWSKGQHVPRPGQPAAHLRRRQPRSMPHLCQLVVTQTQIISSAPTGEGSVQVAPGPDPEERRTDGAAQPTAQPTPLLALAAQPAPLLALAEGREEAALAGGPAGGSTHKLSL